MTWEQYCSPQTSIPNSFNTTVFACIVGSNNLMWRTGITRIFQFVFANWTGSTDNFTCWLDGSWKYSLVQSRLNGSFGIIPNRYHAVTLLHSALQCVTSYLMLWNNIVRVQKYDRLKKA